MLCLSCRIFRAFKHFHNVSVCNVRAAESSELLNTFTMFLCVMFECRIFRAFNTFTMFLCAMFECRIFRAFKHFHNVSVLCLSAESSELLNTFTFLFIVAYTSHIHTCHVLLLLLTVPMYTTLSTTQIYISTYYICYCYSLITVAQENSANQTTDVFVGDQLQPPLD